MIKAIHTPHSQGRAASGEMNLLNSLGEQLKLDPEMAKLFTGEGELPADFQEALKEMSFEDAQKLVETLNQEVETAGAKQQQLNEQLAQLLPDNVSRLGEARAEAVPATPEQLEIKSLLSKQQGHNAQKDAAVELAPKMRNAEDASRAFMPERKSIFAVQKQAAQQNIAQNQTEQNQAPQKLQNTQGLVDLNQFINKQSPSVKNRALSAQYKNEQQSMLTNKAFMEKQMPNLGTVAPTANESEGSGLEDWSQGQEHLIAPKIEAANTQASAGGAKVFDINSLIKTNDLEAVINQIQDYVVQAKAAKEPTAQMTFNHPELGDIDILVKKGAGEQVHVTIAHQGQEAAKFFKQHQGELLQTLQQSGVQVGEFKLEASSSNNNGNQNNFDQNGKQQFANQQQRSNQEQQRRDDSQRREELWNLLNNERKFA